MGLYAVMCPSCKKLHIWFSGEPDQRCEACKKPTKQEQTLERMSRERDRLLALVEKAEVYLNNAERGREAAELNRLRRLEIKLE